MMKVLIYGKNSYIGSHIMFWLQEKHGHEVINVDAKEITPEQIDYSDVNVVIDVAGIAHIKITPEMEDLFYSVNRDLAIRLCEASKKNGVKQFIYFSSMNVYGDTANNITSIKQEAPDNFYGDSKLQADKAIHKMSDESFKVVSVRPPVVYGNGCKGNFSLLLKIAKYTPIFPKKKNIKSMIYIDHLCEFIAQVIKDNANGIFHPQNVEYTSTVETICAIRKEMGKSTMLIGGFSWLIKFASKFSRKIKMAFADDYCNLELSKYNDNQYCLYDFQETINRTINGETR